MEGYLHLSNGMRLKGSWIGAPVSTQGELVFTTGMVGYTKTLTDPSFYGQMLVFTYPLMGNYGVPKNSFESNQISTAGVIVSTHSSQAFHWQCSNTLHEWLCKHGIPGLSEIDTRQLTQLIRNSPHLYATLSPEPALKSQKELRNDNLLSKVSVKKRRVLGRGTKRIALLDFGVKWNIVRHLLSLDCEIEVLPWDTPVNEIDCSGWVLSNGPGDPQNTGDLVERVQALLKEDRPLLGICLGYQLLALAGGAKTQKLAFGHRGHNHSVQLVGTQKGFMTSQNHGFIVVEETLPCDWKPWFRHLNDQTLEGIHHQEKPFFGVQFHPEAAAGPQDTAWILEEFAQRIK